MLPFYFVKSEPATVKCRNEIR